MAPQIPVQAVAPVEADGPKHAQEPEIPIFGARAAARQLSSQLTEVDGRNQRLLVDNARLESELAALRGEVARLGLGPALELDSKVQELRRLVAEESVTLDRERAAHLAALAGQRKALATDVATLEARRTALEQAIVVTSDVALLQEAGLYEYRHVLSDSIAYQSVLASLRDQLKTMARKDGGAVLANTAWTVNGSLVEGRAMVRDFSKLMLRAYNAEADSQVRAMKPYKLASAIDRLTKVAQTIARLGKTMDIRIAGNYHGLRVRELELTADYLEKLAEEKQRDREEKARLREERLLQQELVRERARLDKERQHYANALAAMVMRGDEAAVAELRGQLSDIEKAMEDVNLRAANVRAGYVYVISNMGAFGERMVKIGMTRRLEPMDRIRELSDASVPFNFDVHALFFADDAVGIEAELHRRFAAQRVNRVNQRREFFYATPHEVKQQLVELAGNLLQYNEEFEAPEFRRSGQRSVAGTP